VGFSFALARRGQLLILSFKLLLFRRGRRIRSVESSGPPLFEPSLKVERDIAHNQNSAFEPLLGHRLDRNMRRVADHLHASIGSDGPEHFKTRKNFSVSMANLLVEVESFETQSLTPEPRNLFLI
jgi:hypothetical protein